MSTTAHITCGHTSCCDAKLQSDGDIHLKHWHTMWCIRSGQVLWRSSWLQSSHEPAILVQASEQLAPAKLLDMPASMQAHVALTERAAWCSPVDDGSMPVPKVSTFMLLCTCTYSLSQ